MKYYTYTLKMGILNILAFILFFLCFFIVVPFYGILTITDFKLVLLLSILYLFLHEIVHYFGFIFNKGVNRKNIVMGAKLEKGVLYCMCKQPIEKKVIIKSIFAPLVLLGFFTIIIGFIFRLDLLIFLSIVNISGAIGDIIMGLFILKLPNDIKYIDFDDCTSFTILSKKEINNKFLGIKLIDNGNYNKNMIAHNYKKFDFSWFSIIIFLIIIILILL